jgi:ketosteroid isomerase-like protein
MGQAEIDVLQSAYEAANRGDWDVAFRHAHSGFEWKTDDRLPNDGTYRGPAEISRFLEDQREPFDEVLAVPEEFFEQEDRIVVFVRMRSRPKGSTRFSESYIAHLWTFRDEKAERCEAFAEREQALEAAGLTKDVRRELSP